MQISKSLLVSGAAAVLCLVGLSVRAADTPVQAKARAVLAEKLKESPAQPAEPRASASAPAVAPAPAPAARPAFTPAPPADSQTITQAREALRKKIQELDGLFTDLSGPSVSPESLAKARELLHQAVAQPQVSNVAQKPEHSQAGSPKFPALEGPALPISAEKQQRLNDLLRKYQSDQITPEQYHAERARILGQQ